MATFTEVVAANTKYSNVQSYKTIENSTTPTGEVTESISNISRQSKDNFVSKLEQMTKNIQRMMAEQQQIKDDLKKSVTLVKEEIGSEGRLRLVPMQLEDHR